MSEDKPEEKKEKPQIGSSGEQHMEDKVKTVLEQFVDYLLPELTPNESCVYLYLLRNSFLRDGSFEVRMGKRTIAAGCGKGSRAEKMNYAHVTKVVKGLEDKECIRIGDAQRQGTLYIARLPRDIPLVAEKMASLLAQAGDADYFSDPEKRHEVFERDKWTCQYCGDKVSPENVTLDHFVPQSKGGEHNMDNLRTCCLVCNSIKSGKSYEAAAPLLLKSIQERRARSQK